MSLSVERVPQRRASSLTLPGSLAPPLFDRPSLPLNSDTLQVLAPIPKRHYPPSEHEHATYGVLERKLGFWWRTINVPHGLTEGEVNAKLEDGILTLVMPRVTHEMSKKRIQIEWASEEEATGSG